MYYDTVEDYRIKYDGCFTEHEGSLIKISTFYNGEVDEEEDEEPPICCEYFKYALGSDGKSVIAPPFVDKAEDIDFRLLPTGAINLPWSVIYIAKLLSSGVEKYRKIIHPKTIDVIDPFVEERVYLKRPALPCITHPVVGGAWCKSNYYSPDQAVYLVSQGKRLAAAFSKDFYVGVSLKGAGLFLYYETLRVARMNTNGHVLLRKPVHFLYEQLMEFGLTVRLMK